MERAEFVRAIESRKGAEIVRLYTDGPAKLLKTDNPHPDARKRTVVSSILGTRYKENIDKATGGDFKLSPRQWGVSRESRKIVDHKDKIYLTIRSTGKARKVNKAFVSFATGDGKPLAFDAVKPFLPKKSISKKQIEAGVKKEDEVQQRDYSLDSIDMVKFRGQLYKLIG